MHHSKQGDQPKPTKSHAGLPPFSKEYLANEHDAKTFGQPKPTSEWTVERLSNYRDPLALANDIAAALAAELEKVEFQNKVIKQHKEALHRQQEQLAAESEQQELTVKMYLKASDERDELARQLAAELHKVEILTRENDDRDQREAEYAQKMVAEIQARDKLLADEQEKVQTLVDALTQAKEALNGSGYFTPVIDAALEKVKERK